VAKGGFAEALLALAAGSCFTIHLIFIGSSLVGIEKPNFSLRIWFKIKPAIYTFSFTFVKGFTSIFSLIKPTGRINFGFWFTLFVKSISIFGLNGADG